jgi:predicted metalloprotease with PDZ domain
MPSHTPVACSVAGLTIALTSLAGCAVAQPRVTYDVDLSRAKMQIVRITATVPAAEGRAEFVLPVWRPGRYGVLDFAATVREWSARDDLGRPLEADKIRKNAWRIECPPDSRSVSFSYDIYANSLADRTRHVDDSHAFLSGASVFVLSPPHRDIEHRVRLDLPEGWRIACGLESQDSTLIAPSYDVLIDSPIEAGRHQIHAFDADGVRTEVAVWGDVEIDWPRVEESFATIAAAAHRVFGGDVHIGRYVYIIHAYPGGGGGTEHLNSSVCQTSPSTFRDPDDFSDFLSLVAHEYFHTWNVKRFRPAELIPYDYDRENYTASLWLIEGTTSYYDDLLLVRAGLAEPDDYLDRIEGSINSTLDRPGRARSSLSASSYDAWLKLWGPSSPDHANTSVNVYTHGAIASLTLDLLIRRETGGARSLDDVMRLLAARFDWRTKGYEPADIRAIVTEVAGRDLGWFFDRFIDGTEPPPLDEALAVVGLELTRDEPEEDPSFGAATRSDGGREIVTRLTDGDPAFTAGINVGDAIVSINGRSVADEPLAELLRAAGPGATVAIGLIRHGSLREIPVQLGEPRPGTLTLSRTKAPSAEQARHFAAWLGIEQAQAEPTDPEPEASGPEAQPADAGA